MSEQRLTILVKFEVGEKVTILGETPGVVFGYDIEDCLVVKYYVRRIVDGMIYDTVLSENDLCSAETVIGKSEDRQNG